MRKDMYKIWGASMAPWATILMPKNQVCNVNNFRDIMKNVLRISKIWPKYGVLRWSHGPSLYRRTKSVNVNSFRNIMKNVLRMLKDMAKIWGASMIPWVIHIPKNQICNVNSFRDIMKNVLRMRHAKYEMTDKWTDRQTRKLINNALSSSSELCLKFQVSSSSGS
ncbi:hypothetical protein AVEN_144283-1 [Araneus ventricosus]|uniref:Uncharacterized protein n=1 Tax=Araneus ventricosus TaxID=182803 RepID=A0A4Y2JVV6_ARAVE|nr:hypothetical protein AVEN_144283-1 [Araneus ventricosus]